MCGWPCLRGKTRNGERWRFPRRCFGIRGCDRTRNVFSDGKNLKSDYKSHSELSNWNCSTLADAPGAHRCGRTSSDARYQQFLVSSLRQLINESRSRARATALVLGSLEVTAYSGTMS